MIPLERVGLSVIAAVAVACGDGDGGGLVVETLSEYSGTFEQLPSVGLRWSPEDMPYPIGGVRVQVDDQPWAATDLEGRATFEAVDGPFTVRAFQAMEGLASGGLLVDIWELPQVEDDPVVLAVDGSLAPMRSASVVGSVSGGTSGSRVRLYRAGFYAPDVVGADGSFTSSYQWQGQSARTLVLHAVESDDAEPPTQYSGFASAQVQVRDANDPPPTAALVLAPVEQRVATGTVVRPDALSATPLDVGLALRFDDGVSVHLDVLSNQEEDFEYALPAPTGATPWVTVAAWDTATNAESSVAQAVTEPTTALALALPAPVELLEPAEGAEIDEGTTFRWSAGPAGVMYSLRVACWWELPLQGQLRAVSYRAIATSATEVRLPSIPDFTLEPDAECEWDVAWSEDAPDARRHAQSATRTGTTR